MRNIDLSPYSRMYSGPASPLSSFNRPKSVTKTQDFPPYNIEVLSAGKYRISLAIPGFNRSWIAVETQDNILRVKGERPLPNKCEVSRHFSHREIMDTNFHREFKLDAQMTVTGASMAAGILHIDIEENLPDEKKTQRISVSQRGSVRSTNAK